MVKDEKKRFINARPKIEVGSKRRKKHFQCIEFKSCIGDTKQVYSLLKEIKGIYESKSEISF